MILFKEFFDLIIIHVYVVFIESQSFLYYRMFVSNEKYFLKLNHLRIAKYSILSSKNLNNPKLQLKKKNHLTSAFYFHDDFSVLIRFGVDVFCARLRCQSSSHNNGSSGEQESCSVGSGHTSFTFSLSNLMCSSSVPLSFCCRPRIGAFSSRWVSVEYVMNFGRIMSVERVLNSH